MQRFSPKYRINYKFCQENGHLQEKVNLICLEKSCIDKSLICSFCIEEKHHDHVTKPLKHFLEELFKKYSGSPQSNLDKELEELEDQKYMFLDKIKKAVETLSIGFQELEEEVMKQYEVIKSQIITKQTNKNRFKEFYHNMAFKGEGDQNFQIQNYLNIESSMSFKLTNEIEQLAAQTNKKLQEIKGKVVIKSREDYILQKSQPLVKITDEFSQKFKIPWTIKRKGNVFSQEYITSKQTVCYLNTLLKDWTGKLRIKVISLQQMAELTIGIAEEKDLIDCKHIFGFKGNANSFHLNSHGMAHRQNFNYIKAIKNGDIIDVFIKKNKCKIEIKNDICNFIVYNKLNTMFFFNLQGPCEIQVIYPYKKEI